MDLVAAVAPWGAPTVGDAASAVMRADAFDMGAGSFALKPGEFATCVAPTEAESRRRLEKIATEACAELVEGSLPPSQLDSRTCHCASFWFFLSGVETAIAPGRALPQWAPDCEVVRVAARAAPTERPILVGCGGRVFRKAGALRNAPRGSCRGRGRSHRSSGLVAPSLSRPRPLLRCSALPVRVAW